MCPYDDSRLPFILEALDECGVIEDLAKMVAEYQSCVVKREYGWGEDVNGDTAYLLREVCTCTAESRKRKRRFTLVDHSLVVEFDTNRQPYLATYPGYKPERVDPYEQPLRLHKGRSKSTIGSYSISQKHPFVGILFGTKSDSDAIREILETRP